MTHVFTYGSLMFDTVWQAVVKQAYSSERYTIKGFERRALRDADFPAAIYNTRESIYGRLYYNVSDADIQRLDYFESGFYHLHREPMQAPDNSPRLERGKATTEIAIYILKPEYNSSLLAHDWNEEYFREAHLQKFLSNYSGYLQP